MYGNPLIPSFLLSQDPFGDFLKELMKQIHQQLEMPERSQQFGTQTYEQQVVELSKAGKRSSSGGSAWAEPLRVELLHSWARWSRWTI